jgi:hypothetical protein
VFVVISVLISVVAAIQNHEVAPLFLIPIVMVSGHAMTWREWGVNRRAIEALLAPRGEPT